MRKIVFLDLYSVFLTLLRPYTLQEEMQTNAAVACAILGARYGVSFIPPYYIDHLLKRDEYDEIIKHSEDTLI